MQTEFDSIIMGGGPGGYSCAEALAKRGKHVLLIEQAELGGTCLNRGCIPTKALLASAEAVAQIKAAKALGVKTAGIEIDYPAAHKRKDRVVRTLRMGIAKQMEQAGVTVLTAAARILGPGQVEADGQVYTAANIVLATGSAPSRPPIAGIEHAMDSDAALALQEIPQNVAILGGGVIGCEFAQLFADLGASVTVVEMLPALLPGMDTALGEGLAKRFKAKGIKVFTGAKVERIGQDGQNVTLCLAGGQQIEASVCLCATGRLPVYPPGLENLGLEMEGKSIRMTDGVRTSQPAVFAIGDVTGGVMLAHTAIYQGQAAARVIAGERVANAMPPVPSCVYTTPEIAGVGYTQTQAEALFPGAKTGIAPMAANGRAGAAGAREGFAKLVADEDGNILGIHLFCPYATELISPMAALLQKGVTARELAHGIFAHPTVSEGIQEAAGLLLENGKNESV